MNHLLALAAIACYLVVVPQGASAAAHPCAMQADPDVRLACYDQAFPPLTEAAAERAPHSEAERAQDFGLSIRALEERKPEAQREQQINSIDANVNAVRLIQGGQRVLTLDNGQTWQITEGGTRGFLKAGDRVTIRRAMMGSHILSTPGGVGLRVRRLN